MLRKNNVESQQQFGGEPSQEGSQRKVECKVGEDLLYIATHKIFRLKAQGEFPM